MSFVVPLAAASDVATVGGKAAALGELTRAGVAVPPGFAISVAGFTAAMDAIDPGGTLRSAVSLLDAADLAGIAVAGARLRTLVAAAAVPAEIAAAITASYAALAGSADGSAEGGADVAVRSSATVEDSADASFAGLQDTYLGIRGAAAVLEHVARCWASLFNDESLTYRRRLGMDEAGVSMAVVVQEMVAPRAAGVMFTRSPVTGDRSVVAIEGTWGLGSALVSGDVTPDSWVISKITGEITTRRVSPKVKTHRFIPNGEYSFPARGLRATSPATPGKECSGVAPPSPAAVSGPAADATGSGDAAGGGVRVTDTPQELREAPCLTDDEIRALAATARRVEAHYGTPQDIEWAVLDGDSDPAARVVLLQSRPETVWAAREPGPAGAPKPRAADHVLALFGKQSRWT
jgi:pyruvate, water dikinase